MPKLRLIGLTLLALSATAVSHAEETRYVSDELKVAGRVTGGLHQRPEYNVALSEPTLDLAQLPTEVWPNGELPADLASRVQPLFSTDFYREKWLVAVDGSQIEIALDQGEVKAGEFAEPICELELELLSMFIDEQNVINRV